jgi:DNA-3-methyladenine glycosylase II
MKPTRRELQALARRDPRLAGALRRLAPFPGFPDPIERRRSHYGALARAIVYQQLAGAAAATIHARVCALTPGPHFPTPGELLSLDAQALRGAGLSQNKLAALRDLAEHVVERRLVLASLARKDDQEIVERLSEVRGIGTWTAQMFLLFRLGRLDVIAPGDLGVQEGIRLLDALERRPTPREVEARAERWRPLRSVGCWMMWRLVESERGRG